MSLPSRFLRTRGTPLPWPAIPGHHRQVWIYDLRKVAKSFKVADMAGENFDASDYALPEHITMTTKDGLVLPAMIVYPKDFDATKKYPVHVDIYGGPDSPSGE